MVIEDVNREAANGPCQLSARIVINAASFEANLNGLCDLIPIACNGLELVHIRFDGSLARARRTTSNFDKLVKIFSFCLKETLGFHLIAVNKFIKQLRRVVLATSRNPIDNVRHDLDQRRCRQPIKRAFDDAAVVPLAFCKFGFDLIDCSYFREAGDCAIFIDIPQNIFGIKVIGEVRDFLYETSQVRRIVFVVHLPERSSQQIQMSERRQTRFSPYGHWIAKQAFEQLGCFPWRNAGKPCDLRAQSVSRICQVGTRLLANVVIQLQRQLFRYRDYTPAVVAGRYA
ncbi:hypothetical protein LV28_22880 [Pandoraea pnomenusa]|nr:hypothetical protein LV28_22880 [Pandoraea pnomenusa]